MKLLLILLLLYVTGCAATGRPFTDYVVAPAKHACAVPVAIVGSPFIATGVACLVLPGTGSRLEDFFGPGNNSGNWLRLAHEPLQGDLTFEPDYYYQSLTFDVLTTPIVAISWVGMVALITTAECLEDPD